MKERIKELADQAGVRSIYFNEADNIQRFAELIVRECVRVIIDQQEMADQNWQCKDGIHIAYKINDHFGVEE